MKLKSKNTLFIVLVIFQLIGTNSVLLIFNGPKDFTLLKISLASLPCLGMLTLLKHAYSTRLKSSKNVKMSASMATCHFVNNSVKHSNFLLGLSPKGHIAKLLPFTLSREC